MTTNTSIMTIFMPMAVGHVAVPHGDDVDDIHDGCRHAAHGDHYDEH